MEPIAKDCDSGSNFEESLEALEFPPSISGLTARLRELVEKTVYLANGDGRIPDGDLSHARTLLENWRSEIARAGPAPVSTQACPDCSREGHDVDAAHCKYCGGRL